MTDIDLDPGRISILSLKNPIEKKLQIFKGFAFRADQGLALGGKNLELMTAFGLDFMNLRDETKVTKHGV